MVGGVAGAGPWPALVAQLPPQQQDWQAWLEVQLLHREVDLTR
jgi:hypothetical protein